MNLSVYLRCRMLGSGAGMSWSDRANFWSQSVGVRGLNTLVKDGLRFRGLGFWV